MGNLGDTHAQGKSQHWLWGPVPTSDGHGTDRDADGLGTALIVDGIGLCGLGKFIGSSALESVTVSQACSALSAQPLSTHVNHI
jgi:hypothetical protein